MPFKIDAFKASPAVQAMHPAARIGYLYLLSCAWQTDDCTVSADPMQLAEDSGLGDELWAVHGPRILRKFEDVGGRLRNAACFEVWSSARESYQKRARSAEETNAKRSPSRSETETVAVTDDKINGQRTGTVSSPLSVSVTVPLSQVKAVYGLYPKKVGKRAAFAAIERALKIKPFDEMLVAVNAYLRKIKRDRTDPQYIPHPATWFNQGRYDDEEFKPDYEVTPQRGFSNGKQTDKPSLNEIIGSGKHQDDSAGDGDSPGAEDGGGFLESVRRAVGT